MSVEYSVAIYVYTVLLYVYFIFVAHDDWLAHNEWLGNAASINKHLRPGFLCRNTDKEY